MEGDEVYSVLLDPQDEDAVDRAIEHIRDRLEYQGERSYEEDYITIVVEEATI